MTIKNNTMALSVIVLAVCSILAIASISSTSLVFASHDFAANLTGQQEVPPVDTLVTGEAIFVPVIPSNETIDFYVNTTAIQGATQGHIHSGAQGENGPIVVTLFEYDSPRDYVTEKHRFTASNFEGPMQGKMMADLISAMGNGTTYINIHTQQNPEGEIRGQIMGTD